MKIPSLLIKTKKSVQGDLTLGRQLCLTNSSPPTQPGCLYYHNMVITRAIICLRLYLPLCSPAEYKCDALNQTINWHQSLEKPRPPELPHHTSRPPLQSPLSNGVATLFSVPAVTSAHSASWHGSNKLSIQMKGEEKAPSNPQHFEKWRIYPAAAHLIFPVCAHTRAGDVTKILYPDITSFISPWFPNIHICNTFSYQTASLSNLHH